MKDSNIQVVVGISALAVFILGFCIFMAELHARQASTFLSDWQDRNKVPSVKAWRVGLSAAQKAIAWYPVERAAYVERLARVYEWQTIHLNPGRPAAEQSRLRALALYRKSTQLRPFSPYAWSRIVHVKVLLLEFDDEFDKALSQALTLGRWRQQVNALIVRDAIISWHSLNSEQKQWVLAAAERVAIQSPSSAENLLEYSRRFHLGEPFCVAIGARLKGPASDCEQMTE